VRKSFNLPVAIKTEGERWYCDRIINEAIDRTQYPAPGPVQLNIPLNEPLYDLDTNDSAPELKVIRYLTGNPVLDESAIKTLRDQWNSAPSKIILAGQMSPSLKLNELLTALSKDPSVIILTETTSNVSGAGFISCVDRTLAVIPPDKNEEFKPAILLTFGGAIISKKIKAMLRNMHPAAHWHLSTDPEEFHYDTYKSLTSTIAVEPEYFLEKVLNKQVIGFMSFPAKGEKDDTYSSRWAEAAKITTQKHVEYSAKVEFSDFLAYDRIFSQIPNGTAIHLGNSTPVRYAQLFDHKPEIAFYANRGTSGIDGCTSTAAGFAYNYKGTTLLITGDIGFFYDSNGIWNPNLPASLRVIVINNGGGNIFRIIDGPTGHEELEPFIETKHNLETAGIAANFNIPYYKAVNEEELTSQLAKFFSPQQSGRPAILEVITNNEKSAQTLKKYFEYLRKP
jgi:2-succinyl-5-enolpyruvyl-6-hydroxy-3-cyclohexene-1-carboxylate synthase